jgi:hypothetical protein
MLLSLALMASLARAAPSIAQTSIVQAPASPDRIAFGFERLTWGMTEPQARGLFPRLDGAEPDPGQPSSTLNLEGLKVGGCRFTVTLSFERGRLAELTLDSNGVAHLKACGETIKTALSRQYGGEPGGFSTAAHPHGYSEYAAWRGPVTEVTYAALTDGFIAVTFARTPSR